MEEQHPLGFRGGGTDGVEKERCGYHGHKQRNSRRSDRRCENERRRRTDRRRLGRGTGPPPSFVATNVLHSDGPWDRGLERTSAAPASVRNLEHGVLHANRGPATTGKALREYDSAILSVPQRRLQSS